MIKKMYAIIASLVMMALAIVGVSTSATATTATATVTASQPAPEFADIKFTAKSVDKAKKFADCMAEATRVEQPAPPRDPKAYCGNKVHLVLKGKALAQCPAPNEEIRAWASVRLNQKLSAKALSKSVANGRVRVAVKTAIRDRAKVTAKAAVTCLPPGIPPNQLITVCDLSSKQIVTIDEAAFDPSKYSKNLADCNSTPPKEVPSVAIFGSPAHLFVNGDIWVYAEATPANATIAFSASGAGWVSGATPVSTRWDGSACPSGKTCWKVHAWASASPGTMTVTAIASSGGVKSDPASVSWPVLPDNFG
jgi:hypothetical protein